MRDAPAELLQHPLLFAAQHAVELHGVQRVQPVIERGGLLRVLESAAVSAGSYKPVFIANACGMVLMILAMIAATRKIDFSKYSN